MAKAWYHSSHEGRWVHGRKVDMGGGGGGGGGGGRFSKSSSSSSSSRLGSMLRG